MNPLEQAAIAYAELGYYVFPCVPGEKRPACENGVLDATTDVEKIVEMWKRWPNANIGLSTNGLVVIDVDGPDNPWPTMTLYREDLAGAPMALTPRGGRHYMFRAPAGSDIRNSTSKVADKVDVRANGGYIVVAPSIVGGKPYTLPAGQLPPPPSELLEPPPWLLELVTRRRSTVSDDGASPGAGAPIVKGGRNETLTALGGAMRDLGASYAEILALFRATNETRCDPPLGDAEVVRTAKSVSRYEPTHDVSISVDLSNFTTGRQPRENGAPGQRTVSAEPAPDSDDDDDDDLASQDPGETPRELLSPPGFMRRLIDYTMETAPYPNHVMAFTGALAAQAVLTSRKIRDESDVRPNMYIILLADSGSGKDHPRKVTRKIMHELGVIGMVGEKFASGEGIQDRLITNPSVLFQVDEIDQLFEAAGRAKDGRHESMVTTLLSLFNQSSSFFEVRAKANVSEIISISQPHVSIFGTATPESFYGSLTARMMTGGLLARAFVVQAGARAPGQDSSGLWTSVPPGILAEARYWIDYKPGGGNMVEINPITSVVVATPDAKTLFRDARSEADVMYHTERRAGNQAGMAVWARAVEQARKLAILGGASADFQNPRVTGPVAKWALALAWHQVKHSLWMAATCAVDNPFDGQCQRFKRLLRREKGEMLHWKLLKRMHLSSEDFRRVANTLIERGTVARDSLDTGGRPRIVYRTVRQ